MIVARRPSTVIGGTTIFEGVIASAHGLFEVSSTATCLPLLLALRLSRILSGQPRTTPLLANPADPEPEPDSPSPLGADFEVSECSGGKVGRSEGNRLGLSTQPAGVGGMGPKLEMACGLLVGGDITGTVLVSLVRL